MPRSRRRLAAYVAAGTLLVVAGGAAGLVFGVTQTDPGRDWLRRTLLSAVAPKVRGSLYVGAIRGGLFSGVTVDSVVLRSADDSVVAAVGRVHVEYALRDLVDRRVLLRRVDVDRPVIHLRQFEDGHWNYNGLFKTSGSTTPKQGPGFGDFIVADSVRVRGLQFALTLAWHPADSLHGARRDSAIRVALASRTEGGAEIRRSGRYYNRTYRWNGDADVPAMRLARPDSAGLHFAVGRLDLDETDPPFRWRNIRGDVRILGDSVWADFPHWDLPGSTGQGHAKVVWGSDLPIRWNIRVHADSMALADVAWVYPTLPTTGGGTMDLTMRNRRTDLHVLEYALTNINVRTTRSHLTGAMTFAVGGPVLGVQDVDVAMQPVNWDLLRTFNGKALPYDFQGTLTGTVKARGGPVNRFVVDDAQIAYHDAHVPGAVSRVRLAGGLDILKPADTHFRGLRVSDASVDLRTLEFLNPSFPRLRGLITGSTTLDSLYTDVRLSDAHLTHTDGPGPSSTFTGGGRVTFGEGPTPTRYDLTLTAEPLSFTTLARSYPLVVVRGSYGGPIRVTGATDSLGLVTTLSGPAGTLAYDGIVNVLDPRYGATGTFTGTGLDLRTLFDDQRMPRTTLGVRAQLALIGTGLADLDGTLRADLGRSDIGGVRADGGAVALRFAGGRLGVDTLHVETAAGQLAGAGGLGLAGAARDSLRLALTVDSLGGLRRWLSPAAVTAARAAVVGASPAARAAARDPVARLVDQATRQPAAGVFAQAAQASTAPARVDSLAGSLRATITLAGTVDTTVVDGLRASAVVDGRGLGYGGFGAQTLTLRLGGTALRSTPDVTAAVTADSLSAGSVTFANATARFAGTSAAGRYDVTMGSDSGLSLAGAGRTISAGDSTVIALDSARVVPRPGHLWTLAAPTRFVARGGTALDPGSGDTGGVLALDPFTLRGEGEDVGSRLTLAATLPERGAVTGAFDATAVSIQDVAEVVGAGRRVVPVDGRLDATVRLTGTRAEPLFAARAEVGALRLGAGASAARLDSTTFAADYAAHRLRLDLGAFAAGRRLLDATGALPIDLALEPSAGRLPQGTAPADSLRARVRADSLDLALLAALAPGVHDARGGLSATFDVGGTWRAPRLDGELRIPVGAFSVEASGTRLENVHADVGLLGDSVAVRRFSVQSGTAGDTLAVAGWLKLTPDGDPAFAVRVTARDFLAVDRPRLATLAISTPTPLEITGSFRAAQVTGAVRAERGRIYIPELVDKRIVDLNEYRDVVDTTVIRNRTLLPGAPAAFVANLALNDVRLSVGDDVWLRNAEANIKLGGSLAVTRAVAQVNGHAVPQLALLGSLAVERGTYRLDLLPLAQPSFDVEPGTLRFFGAGDLNPALDIRAVHVVRQTRQFTNSPDVHVQVAIGGTLNQPTLQLSSADNPPIPDTDLISYLVTGEPAAAIFGNAQSSDQLAAAASIVSRLAGSLVSGALSRGNGPFDIISVETGAITADPALARSTNSFANILSSTRLGVGGQLGQKTFYTFSTGFCSFSQNTDASTSLFNNFTRGLGVRVERRVTNSFSIQVGVEPALQQQACLANASTRYFQQTPSQGSLDFTKRWTF